MQHSFYKRQVSTSNRDMIKHINLGSKLFAIERIIVRGKYCRESVRNSDPLFIRWELPPTGWFKLNFDGSRDLVCTAGMFQPLFLIPRIPFNYIKIPYRGPPLNGFTTLCFSKQTLLLLCNHRQRKNKCPSSRNINFATCTRPCLEAREQYPSFWCVIGL